MKDIILIGGGGHCKSVIDVVEQEGKFNIIGIIDKSERVGQSVLNYKIIGNDSDLINLVNSCENALISVGQIKSPKARIYLFESLLQLGFSLPTIVSPRAYISKHSSIGIGTIIMHDVVISSGVEIGDNCIINTKSIIEHGSNIKNHCHISTNAVINGEVSVGEGSFIGSGSVTKEGIKINNNFFANAGSVVK
jgi:sugar O-acyltransferase (sialic acid O-acetyltransferase NeuD family)